MGDPAVFDGAGVSVYAELDRAARRAAVRGDERTRGQVMADTLVERVTGVSSATGPPVELRLVMTDHTLLGLSNEPARIVGFGPVAAPLARQLALGRGRVPGGAGEAARAVRRLFTDPAGRTVTMESRSRRFTDSMAQLIQIRDDTCRTPWCDAPIRHIDHITPHAHTRQTTVRDGRGHCERCNYAAQAPGAVSRAVERADGSTVVVTRTPAGQVTVSRVPAASRFPPARGPVTDLIWPHGTDGVA